MKAYFVFKHFTAVLKFSNQIIPNECYNFFTTKLIQNIEGNKIIERLVIWRETLRFTAKNILLKLIVLMLIN